MNGWDEDIGALAPSAVEPRNGRGREARLRAAAGRARRVIEVRPGRLDEAAAALADAVHPFVYMRGVEPVRIGSAAEAGADAAGRDAGAPVIRPCTADWLAVCASERCEFRLPDRRAAAGWRVDDPPAGVLKAFLGAADDLGLRPLRGVSLAPIMRASGALVDATGYDAESALWIDVAPGLELDVPDAPDRSDAEDACRELAHLLRNFPFRGETDLAVALSAVVTAVARPTLPAAPAHGLDAPTAGSGKSLLASVISTIASGSRGAFVGQGADFEELEKRLAGVLLAGEGIVVLDNATRVLGGDFLCQAVSEETLSLRRLGTSDVTRVNNTMCLLITGNNLSARDDFTRRLLICRLDARAERPELRRIDQDVLAEAREQRGAYLGCALTLMRAHRQAGAPQVAAPALGGFAAWDGQVRQALLWAGTADPVETMSRVRAEDPAQADLVALFEAWNSALGQADVTVGELIDLCADDAAVAAAVDAVAGTRSGRNPRRLAAYLKRHEDRRVAGRWIERRGTRKSVAVWRLTEEALR